MTPLSARRTRDVDMGSSGKIMKNHPRLVRYDDLIPCRDAFIDTRSPGSDQKENFTIIGPGVSENPNQHIHIAEPHGFNIGGARQPSGCTNSQHSHDTAEVFFIHSGDWAFRLGEHGEAAEIILKPGELISIPTQVFRGFENVGTDEGFIWAVLGGDDPGSVLWAPSVFDMAEDYGLVLMENGSLIDVGAGQTVPEDVARMPRTSRVQIDALQTLGDDDLAACCVVGEAALQNELIGPEGAITWEHGFTLQRINVKAGDMMKPETWSSSDVLFLHHGVLEVMMGDELITMHPGDTLTIPAGVPRHWETSDQADFIRVRGQ